MSLHPLVGHEDVRQTILGAVARESLPAALLVHGPKGVGKQRLALWIGQLLMCDSPTSSGPCDRCGPCKMGLNLEHPDLNWYFPLLRPKGASGERLVGALEDARMDALADRRAEPLQSSHFDELRGLYLGMVRNLRRRATMRPAMAEGQIFIIGNAELLVPQESSPEAANALLKLLEEPPGAARFILTTSEPGRLLTTIRSRTVPVHIAGLPEETVASFLVDARGVDHQVALWAARLSQGSIGRALGFLPDRDDLGSLEALRRKAYALIAAAMAGEKPRAVESSWTSSASPRSGCVIWGLSLLVRATPSSITMPGKNWRKSSPRQASSHPTSRTPSRGLKRRGSWHSAT